MKLFYTVMIQQNSMMTNESNTPLSNDRSSLLGIFFLFFFLFAISTKRSVSSWNDASRMATIESLVERRTLAIDDSSFEDITSDKYRYQDHIYSSKPPGLAILGSIAYIPLYIRGITFINNPGTSYFLVTLLTIGAISALGLVYFWKILVEFFTTSRRWANVTTFIAGVGTLVLPYSLVFNSHVVCGSLLIIGFYYALKYLHENEIRFVIFSGLLFSLAGSIDTSCLIFLPIVFLLFLKDSYRSALIFTAACFPFLAFYFSTNLFASGSLLPPTLNAPLRSSSGSVFTGDNLSGLASHDNFGDTLIYSYHMLIGKRGLISHTPILIFTFLGIFNFLRKRQSEPYVTEYLLVVAGCGLYVLLAVLRTNNYSGNAFGVRWFSAIMLILMLSLGVLEEAIRSNRKYRFAFWTVSIISIVLAIIGSYRPFLPSTRPVVGEPQIVENTIMLAIERLLTLSTLEGRIRIIILLILVTVIFVFLSRQYALELEGE